MQTEGFLPLDKLTVQVMVALGDGHEVFVTLIPAPVSTKNTIMTHCNIMYTKDQETSTCVFYT